MKRILSAAAAAAFLFAVSPQSANACGEAKTAKKATKKASKKKVAKKSTKAKRTVAKR